MIEHKLLRLMLGWPKSESELTLRTESETSGGVRLLVAWSGWASWGAGHLRSGWVSQMSLVGDYQWFIILMSWPPGM